MAASNHEFRFSFTSLLGVVTFAGVTLAALANATQLRVAESLRELAAALTHDSGSNGVETVKALRPQHDQDDASS